MKDILIYDSFPHNEVVALFKYFEQKECHFYPCLEMRYMLDQWRCEIGIC